MGAGYLLDTCRYEKNNPLLIPRQLTAKKTWLAAKGNARTSATAPEKSNAERNKLNCRTFLRRLTRLKLGFSKRVENHAGAFRDAARKRTNGEQLEAKGNPLFGSGVFWLKRFLQVFKQRFEHVARCYPGRAPMPKCTDTYGDVFAALTVTIAALSSL